MDSKGFGEAVQESRGRIEQAEDEMVVCISLSVFTNVRCDDEAGSHSKTRNIEVEALTEGGK